MSKKQNTKADSLTLEWVTTTLVNDEASDDQDLREHFESGGDMPYAEACFYVSQRDEALRDPLNFVLQPYEPKQNTKSGSHVGEMSMDEHDPLLAAYNDGDGNQTGQPQHQFNKGKLISKGASHDLCSECGLSEEAIVHKSQAEYSPLPSGWMAITDVRDPAFGHATHEHEWNGGEVPKGSEIASVWQDPHNERWLGKAQQAQHSPLPAKWHDCEVAEKQIKLLQQQANQAQALAEDAAYWRKRTDEYSLQLASTHNQAQALAEALRGALADLEGIMPEFEPDGERTHPGWTTIKEARKVIANWEGAK